MMLHIVKIGSVNFNIKKNIWKIIILFYCLYCKLLIYFKKYELKILANNKVYQANWVIVTNAIHYGGAFQVDERY